MEIVLYLIFFGAGAAAVFFYFKTRLRKGTGHVQERIDKNGTGGRYQSAVDQKTEADTYPDEILDLARKPERFSPAPAVESVETGYNQEAAAQVAVMKKTIDDLLIVNELGQNVTSSLNMEETFGHLYTTINSMMDAAVMELRVLNKPSGEWKLFSNLRSVENRDWETYSNPMADWCFKNNREVFLADAENDYERYVFSPLILPDGRVARSVIIFPVQDMQVVSGTLCIISFQRNTFEDYHLKIIRLLLGYISVAMQNALTHEELNRTKTRAERSEKFMQEFLAKMSHEIRTPMNAVMGMTNLLLDKNPQQQQLRYLSSIKKSSETLLVILNDILDLSKIEAGKIELEKIDFSIHEVAGIVYEIMLHKADEKDLQLMLEIDPAIPRVLAGDPTRLNQILMNLLGNAIKFTNEGTVGMKIGMIGDTTSPDKVSVKFEIRDTGIGMTGEQLIRIFEKFAQADPDTARKYGGTGLGLNISRQLIELHGSSLMVESRYGAGSTFSFMIAYERGKKALADVVEPAISASMLEELRGLRVLVCEDVEHNRIVIADTLELKIPGIQIRMADNGYDAIEFLKQSIHAQPGDGFDLVLMDINMPGMDGLTAIRKIRSEFPSPINQINIVAFTASVIKSEIARCFEAGANGFIPKPFHTARLLNEVYRNSGRSGSNPELPGQNRISYELENPHPANHSGTIDLAYLRGFVEGDHERYRNHIQLYLSKTPMFLKEIKAAIEANDLEKLRVSVHNLKPLMGIMGVHEGVSLSEEIERICLSETDRNSLAGLVLKLDLLGRNTMVELAQINS